MAGDFRARVVERLVLEQFGQLGFRLAAFARFFLAQALGLDALVFFLLRADRVGLGQIDFFLRARLAVVPGLAVRRPAQLRFVLPGAAAVRAILIRSALVGPAPDSACPGSPDSDARADAGDANCPRSCPYRDARVYRAWARA